MIESCLWSHRNRPYYEPRSMPSACRPHAADRFFELFVEQLCVSGENSGCQQHTLPHLYSGVCLWRPLPFEEQNGVASVVLGSRKKREEGKPKTSTVPRQQGNGDCPKHLFYGRRRNQELTLSQLLLPGPAQGCLGVQTERNTT